MTGNKYRELKKSLAKKEKYDSLKSRLVRNTTGFDFSDNLFNLVEIMRTGTQILKIEKFPIKEFMIYDN
jgi:hypothetical protein